ncbi:uncharacterized protein LOC122261864 [Penaeus japonicus]|uniref:uncharacterized protein LOC122261864 n=1 Tax=Penaeus japonicus TaxID=27405 RepID=UPI001C713B55|nr:uncharacterized protein LOC122261864 [Penaeus japonicus]
MRIARTVACLTLMVSSAVVCLGYDSATLPNGSDCSNNSPDCSIWALNIDFFCKSKCDREWQYKLSKICGNICKNCSLTQFLQRNRHVIGNQPLLEFPFANCSTGQQYWQHPMDDSKFIKCEPTGPKVKSCELDSVWDQNLLMCKACTGYHPDCLFWAINIESFCKSTSKDCPGYRKLVKICQRKCENCGMEL